MTIETQAYMQGKVWQDGFIQEDMELFGQERNGNISLVVRDKDDIRTMSVPTEVLLRSVFQPKPDVRSLDVRIEELMPQRTSGSKTRRSTRKASKHTRRSRSRSTSRDKKAVKSRKDRKSKTRRGRN